MKAKQPVYHDELKSQLKNLIKIRNPRRQLTQSQLEDRYQEWIKHNSLEEYGVYVYYPWNNRLVHLLGKEEFIEMRTSRNKYKITDEEQHLLATKTIGIIGLSVGQSVALTAALERTCGKMRLADFDHLELSNLNRLRSGVQNLGLPKTLIVAREIAEIDPYSEVELFRDGITEENLDNFLSKDGTLDLLIEECDALPIKIKSRKSARDLRIPVVMDTSDKGMLDIERFDQQPDRQLFHGLIPGLNQMEIDNLPDAQKINILLKLVGGMSISSRLKSSLIELNESIGSWPQLSSSVALGGAITTDVARKILLGRPVQSGRFYVDLDEVFKEDQPVEDYTQRPAELTRERMEYVLNQLSLDTPVKLDPEMARLAVEQAAQAPPPATINHGFSF
ncbi:MAG: ThiF family adenylyltransferase [Owenweeksia sp.]|nr:ThiF family adenylyltransferase [Owenweeksia sp.]